MKKRLIINGGCRSDSGCVDGLVGAENVKEVVFAFFAPPSPRLWTSLESLTPFSYLDAMLSTYEFLDRITNTLNTPPPDQMLKNRPFSAFAQA